ncbi:hypothetical protein BGZ94_000401, partial [Podila epigama]
MVPTANHPGAPGIDHSSLPEHASDAHHSTHPHGQEQSRHHPVQDISTITPQELEASEGVNKDVSKGANRDASKDGSNKDAYNMDAYKDAGELMNRKENRSTLYGNHHHPLHFDDTQDEHLAHHHLLPTQSLQTPQSSQDRHPRPDSPTSLEDSQSESGFDSHSIDTIDTERSLSGLDSSSQLLPPSEFKSIMFDPSNNSSIESIESSRSNNSNSSNSNSNNISNRTISTTTLQSNSASKEGQEHLQSSSNHSPSTTPSPSLSGKVSTTAESVDSHDAGATVTSGAITSATATAPSEPQRTTPVPKVSAWSTLLPGVSPIPTAPKVVARTTTSRSTDLRLHELFPIVLAHENEAKLTMEMLDLFE